VPSPEVPSPEVDEPTGLTRYERYELAYMFIGLAISVGLTVWMFSREDGQMFYRLRWELEQRRKRREYEAAFARSRNLMLFEAWTVLTGANAQ
jgi:hypothetical protein